MKNDELPFKENIKNNIFIREFNSDINENELKWHTDDEDRIIVCEHDTSWKIQIDNNLPKNIIKNKPFYIKKNVFHRLLKGDDKLILKINKIK